MITTCRNLVIVLGDQLNLDSAAFDGFDREQDIVWMAEVAEESKHVWTHKARIAIFLSGMRHFANSLRKKKFHVEYRQLDDKVNRGSLSEELGASINNLRPKRLVVVQPGEWRVLEIIHKCAERASIEVDLRSDRHFLSTPEEFADHAKGRKQLRLEYFYREMRRKHNVLMDGNEPEGGKWNYDADNRGAFGKEGPTDLPRQKQYRHDKTTKKVLELVEHEFAEHPGSLDDFDWPVTTRQAEGELKDFIENRLASFGEYQDAMWTDEPYLYHSRLSAALNLKLLDPRDVIEEAIVAYRAGRAPLNSVEGFVRQILGWREYVRGIYWLYMPEYLQRNTLNAKQSLPEFYWTGDTDMHCLSQTIGQTLNYGYAHHIQRLMVTGLFALLLGVYPKQVHEWYLAVYVDAVEWVELPNSLGMSQFADDGVMASKPYVATGKYIQRMSNYCEDCCYDPKEASGENACPFTTLYWDFLAKHKKLLAGNNRMSMQLRNLDRKEDAELKRIRQKASQLRASLENVG